MSKRGDMDFHDDSIETLLFVMIINNKPIKWQYKSAFIHVKIIFYKIPVWKKY